MKLHVILYIVLLNFILGSCAVTNSGYQVTTSLNLSRKKLTEIPAYVYEMKDLKILRLYGNQLDSISYRIGELQNLEELYIGRNNLKGLPKELGQLKNLKILSAQYNEIDSLPSEIGQLENLDQLILNQNELHSLPEEIGNLKKLASLQLKYNWLDSLPETIGNCENLQFLFLNRNNLQGLPSSLGKISHLRELYLSGAGLIVEIPESFCDLRLLEVLEVDMRTVVPTCLLVRQTTRLKIIQQ